MVGEMPQFRYIAYNPSGAAVEGSIEADDSRDLAGRLREMGLYLAEASPAAEPTSAALARPSRRVSSSDIVLFTRQLADLVEAGVPLHRSLTVIEEQASSTAMRSVVHAISDEVQRGSSLSDTLYAHGRLFPRLYSQMVRAGEVSGHLDVVLARLADFLEKEQVRRAQVISAFIYPCVVLTVATAAVAFLLSFLVPRISVIFADLGQALPAPTRALLVISNFLQRSWWALILAAALIIIAWRQAVRTEAGRRLNDVLISRLPIFGPVVRKVVLSRFARTLGTLLSGGVAMLEAIELAGAASGSWLVSSAVEKVREDVRQGESLSRSLENAGGFPPVLLHMTAVGEETGRLPEMLLKLSDSLDFESDQALRRLTTLLEPMVILAVGGIVGFIVLSILLPVLTISTALPG
jgi:type II secretion system protein F